VTAGGLYRPLVWSLSALLLGLGVLLAIQMISSVIGPFRFAELGSREPRTRVGIALDSPALAARWREWLPQPAGLEPIASLDLADAARLGALVLPEPRALDEHEVVALLRYVAAGGGVVVTGSIGVSDRAGAWRGYERMQSLLGGAEVIQVGAEQAAALEAGARGPLSAPLAPGAKIAVQREPGLPALSLADAELRWAGEARGASGPAASLRRSLGAGRIAWLAVGPERGAGEAEGARPLADVLDAALAWVSHEPRVELLAWPEGAAFAATLAERDREAGQGDSAAASGAVEREIAWARAAGALAHLRLPADAPSPAQPADLLRKLAGRGAWVATRSELSSWARTRSSIEARVQRAGPRRLFVAVTNHARQPAAGVVLRLHLNERTLRAGVEATAVGQRVPALRFRSGRESLDLALPELAARRSASYAIDYEPAPRD
jgi:hypothetical protein